MIEINSLTKLLPGQRWISETEPELGVGTLVSHDKRTIKIHFTAGDCLRQYARKSAPLRRLVFKPGDKIQTRDGLEFIVDKVQESKGLLVYCQEEHRICEKELCDAIDFSLPQDRLLAGLAGSSKDFDLRYDILKQKAAYEKSEARGFLGGQIDLIPHQFFIAREITSRVLPRVLLSDETGLGKTIEACLILHHLLISHRILRVLIIVPESLVHQWFVELYRKFNLSFRLFNEDHCQQSTLAAPGTNPFLDDQQGICSQSFIQSSKMRKQQILSAGWDMVIMDEAHHILDQPNFYTFMQALGKNTQGLMLLTATPEQMGLMNHFSQLQLLDPDRYFDFTTYQAQTSLYGKTAKKVKSLIKAKKDPGSILDTYGPGRIIFRNKREQIKGFPKKTAHMIPLKGSPDQIQQINKEFHDPDRIPKQGLENDPRIVCLAKLAKKIKPEKILVIAGSKAKVEAIDTALKSIITIDAAKFDETMSLLHRDRNAAWFSREDGARLLICSEIGSEGRNFQFVHHLFLFDLPRNPELLEQRMGRVDRIGQKHGIQIHVPFVKGSVFEVLAHWYDKGLNLFENNINGVHYIFKQFKERLDHLIHETITQETIPLKTLEQLLSDAAQYTAATQEELNQGKNILLELNSFKPGPAKDLIQKIQAMDMDQGLELLLESLLDKYGIEMDRTIGNKREKIIHLKKERMVDEEFPCLPRRGNAITFDRQTAIAREDLGFFNWDHPYVNQVFDFFITKGEGACATARIKKGNSPGLFLEAVFVLECIAPARLNMERFLPADPIRILVSHLGENFTDKEPFPDFLLSLEPDTPAWFLEFEQIKTQMLPELFSQTRSLAQKKAEKIIKTAKDRIQETVGREIDRLVELQKINPDIQEREISLAKDQLLTLMDHLSKASLRLDALRLIRVDV